MNQFTIERTPEAFIFTPKQKEQSDFRILQVTDMHLPHIGIADRRELKEIAAMAQHWNVDLVVNTGDLFCHNIQPLIHSVIAGFDKYVGSIVPWTFAWGNHDQENITARSFTKQFDKIEHILEHLPHCLYRQTRTYFDQLPGISSATDSEETNAVNKNRVGKDEWKKWDGFYGGNFRFEIHDALTNKILWNLFVLNSRKWAHIPPIVLEWMQNILTLQEFKAPTLLFYHVPNYEYEPLWESGQAHGILREKVSYEHDKGRIHAILKELPSIKGAFVGHDHLNDYWGEMDGIIYGYGRKTGMNSYGTLQTEPTPEQERKMRIGAKVITLSFNPEEPMNSIWDHFTVFPDGSTWRYGD